MVITRKKQLNSKLEKKISYSYLLYGNDQFLLKENQTKIIKIAEILNFKEKNYFVLDNKTEWDVIFNLCKNFSLFTNKKMFLFFISNNKITNDFYIKISNLLSLINDNLLYIFHIKKISNNIKYSKWLKIINEKSIKINCNIPKNNDLLNWVCDRAKQMKISLEKNIYKKLCEYFTEDLLKITTILKKIQAFHLINQNISLSKIDNIIYEMIDITPENLIHFTLSQKYKLSYNILYKLKLENIEPVILLRKFQHEILLLIILKNHMKKQQLNTNLLLNKYKILHNQHRLLLTKALQVFDYHQLNEAIKLMFQLELEIKQITISNPWIILETLIFILCFKKNIITNN